MSSFRTVVLFEKPNQARIFSKAYKLFQKKIIKKNVVAYYDRENGMCAVHLSGHLLELKPPQHYKPSLKDWNLDDLPVFPTGSRWEMEPKKHDKPAEQSRILSLIAGIKWAMVDCGQPNEIAIGVDNDKEGELLGWEMLEYLNLTEHPNMTRLLFSQVTEKSIRKAFEDRIPAQEKYSRYISGLARLYGDWLFGMNVTMGVTAKNQEMIPPFTSLNSGRVIYSISYLIYLRYLSIVNFRPRDFYSELVNFKTDKGEPFFAKLAYPEKVLERDDEDEPARLYNSELAAKYNGYIKKVGKGTVSRFDKEDKKTSPPVGFHRTGFDRHMLRKHGMDLDKISKALQSLYDSKGLVTYPRVDVKYLDDVMHAEMPAYLSAMSKNILSAPQLTEKEREKYKKVFSFVDQNKKSKMFKKGIAEGESHHAIIPTDQVADLSGLTQDEFLVYRELLDRLLIQFLPDYEYASTTIEINVGQTVCKTKGKVPLRAGWKAVSQDMEEEVEEKEDNDSLPLLDVGDVVFVVDSETKKSTTVQPKNYKTDELLAHLENPKKFVKDKNMLPKLSKMQIGTDGTRQDHVTGLERKGFANFVKKGKNAKVAEIVPTKKLLMLIKTAPDYFKLPEVSAYWESFFESIMNGDSTLEEFLMKNQKLIERYFAELKNGVYDIKEPIVDNFHSCPKNGCGGNLFLRTIKKKKNFSFWGCSRCKSSFFDDSGNVGGEMLKDAKKAGPWQPPEGATPKKCPGCSKKSAYHRKFPGKSWSTWECIACRKSYFDSRGSIGNEMKPGGGKKKK